MNLESYEGSSVTPNPSAGLVDVTLTNDCQIGTVSVHDLKGQVVETFKIQDLVTKAPHTLRLDLQNISSGMYYLRVSHDGYLENRRVVIVH